MAAAMRSWDTVWEHKKFMTAQSSPEARCPTHVWADER